MKSNQKDKGDNFDKIYEQAIAEITKELDNYEALSRDLAGASSSVNQQVLAGALGHIKDKDFQIVFPIIDRNVAFLEKKEKELAAEYAQSQTKRNERMQNLLAEASEIAGNAGQTGNIGAYKEEFMSSKKEAAKLVSDKAMAALYQEVQGLDKERQLHKILLAETNPLFIAEMLKERR